MSSTVFVLSYGIVYGEFSKPYSLDIPSEKMSNGQIFFLVKKYSVLGCVIIRTC